MKDISDEKCLAFPIVLSLLCDDHKMSGKTIAASSGDGFYGDIDYLLWGRATQCVTTKQRARREFKEYRDQLFMAYDDLTEDATGVSVRQAGLFGVYSAGFSEIDALSLDEQVSPASNRNCASLQSLTVAESIEVEGVTDVQLKFYGFDTARTKSSMESVCPG